MLGCDVEGVVEVGQELAGAYDLEAPVAGRGMVAELHLWIGHVYTPMTGVAELISTALWGTGSVSARRLWIPACAGMTA